MSRAERRLTVILLLALALWATDFMHHVHPGWIGLAAGLATLVPIVGVMPVTVFTERVKFGPFFYIAAILGLGAVMVHTGVSTALGDGVLEHLKLQGGEDAKNFAILTMLSTFAGVVVTNVAQPALLTPLAGHLAEVVGWPLKAVLMTIVLGFTTVVLPFQTPPAVVGMAIAGLKMRTALRLTVPLALASLLVLLPLDYWWWRALDYFATR
jgi:di/tricarboxylate transporter